MNKKIMFSWFFW